jgi:hypothetical protein
MPAGKVAERPGDLEPEGIEVGQSNGRGTMIDEGKQHGG